MHIIRSAALVAPDTVVFAEVLDARWLELGVSAWCGSDVVGEHRHGRGFGTKLASGNWPLVEWLNRGPTCQVGGDGRLTAKWLF